MVIIRKADPSNAYAIGMLHYEAWKETYKGLMSDQYLNSLQLNKFVDQALSCYENTYVAIYKEEVIGFASYCNSYDNKLGSTGEITALYIKKEYQGHGFGRYLIQNCLRDLYNYKNITLWTSVNNVKSIEFYHHFGFVEDGDKKNLPLSAKEIHTFMRMRRRLKLYN